MANTQYQSIFPRISPHQSISIICTIEVQLRLNGEESLTVHCVCGLPCTAETPLHCRVCRGSSYTPVGKEGKRKGGKGMGGAGKDRRSTTSHFTIYPLHIPTVFIFTGMFTMTLCQFYITFMREKLEWRDYMVANKFYDTFGSQSDSVSKSNQCNVYALIDTHHYSSI